MYNSTLEECRIDEQIIQTLFDVVSDIRFFNRSLATANNYDNPEYATYKHYINQHEIRRLPRNHEKVLSGEWVGVTKGHIVPEERLQFMRDNFKGENGSFYGRKHTQESIDKNRECKKLWWINNPEHVDIQSKRATLTFKGKKQTPSHIAKRSVNNMGFVIFKHQDTGEILRLHNESDEFKNLDRNIWKNPHQLREIKLTNCTVCGVEGEDCYMFNHWHNDNCRLIDGFSPHKCIYCGVFMKITANTRIHEKKCKLNPDYVEKVYKCPHCNSVSNHLKGFIRYHFDNCAFNQSNDKPPQTCMYCDSIFSTTILLKEHYKICKKPKFTKTCEYCNFISTSEKGYELSHGDNCKYTELNRTCIHCNEISKTPYLHKKHHGDNCKYIDN